ncbi:MAG TPA: hypothetical protein VL401_00405 [Alphaproteobacteria bacterium]|jgi:hypothetical protein|nr:hypothetical protein [Alphaproteobacteria bacterium]
MTERIFKGKGKNFKSDVLIDGVPGKDMLEMMAGANKWHQRARFVFAQEKGQDFDLIEAELHEGRQIIEAGKEDTVFGTRKMALETYKEFEQRVAEFGGDVSEYAKQASGLTRAELDYKIREYSRNS